MNSLGPACGQDHVDAGACGTSLRFGWGVLDYRWDMRQKTPAQAVLSEFAPRKTERVGELYPLLES